MATIGALVFEMSANVARLQQDMAKARSTVEGAMAGIETAAKLATTALGALGVGASAAAFQAMVTGAAESMNALHELSLRTGATVEQLSALRGVAKAAGTDMDTVAGLTNKLEKNMLDFARGGGGKAAGAFQELGISMDTAKKALESGDIAGFMQLVASKLAGMESGAQRAAYAQELMGKSGAALLPFLMELSRAGQLNAKVTTEQAEAAHVFEVNMMKLQGQSNKLKLEIANALIPSLNEITTAMLDARRAGDGFFGSMIEGARRATAAMMGWNNAGDLGRINKQIVELTDKWMGLEKMQGTRGISAERVAGVKAELDALVKKKQTLEGIAAIEQGGGITGKQEPVKTAVVEIAKKENDLKEKGISLDELMARAAMKRLQLQDQIAAEGEAAAKAAADAAQRMNDDLAKQAEHWKDLIDPQRVYGRQMEELMKLYSDGLISIEQWNQAAAIVNANAEKAAGLVGMMGEKSKETKSYMAELGMVMVSTAEDAILHWKGLGNVLSSILSDMGRVILRRGVTDPLAGLAGDFLKSLMPSAGVTPPARAGGGPVSGGSPYMVGELGPELFVPSGSGTIIPHGAGGGTVVQNVTINQGSGSNVQEMLALLLPAMQSTAQSVIINQKRPGGLLAG